MAVINRRQILTHQTRHRLNHMTAVSHRDRLGADPQVDHFANQTTGHRVCIGSHHDRAAGRHSNALHDVVRIESRIRESSQISRLFQVIFATTRVGFRHQVFDKSDIVFATIEVSTAAKQQSLIDTTLQMMIGGFDITIFIGTPGIRTFGLTVVVLHQRRVTLREFTLRRVVSDSGGQRVAAMPQWDSAEFPERFLNAGTERLEGLRETQRHTLLIAECQHAVIEQMVKSQTSDLHAQVIAVGEVTGSQSSRMMLLTEVHRLPGAMHASPLIDTPLERPPHRVRESHGLRVVACLRLVVGRLQPLKQSLRFQAGLHFQLRLNFRPDIDKRVRPSPIISRASVLLRRQPVAVPILPRRLFAHFSHPR